MPAIDPAIPAMITDYQARMAELSRLPRMMDWLRQQAGLRPIRVTAAPRSEDHAFRSLLAGVAEVRAALDEHPQLIRNPSVINALISIETAEDAARKASQ